MTVRNRFIPIILITIFCFSVIVLTIPIKTTLIFYERNTDKISAYLPVEPSQTFQIIFTHSIHLTDVIEKYEVTEEFQIKQYEIVFEEFGISMSSNAEGNEEFVYENGKYHIKNMNNIFSSMNIRNGKTVSKHRFIWEDKKGKEHMIYFNKFFEPGEWFTVKVEKLSLLETWKEVKIRE